MSVRAKFQVTSIETFSWSKTAKKITLSAIYDTSIPEDRRFAAATPSGTLTMQVDNPAAAEQFELGKSFYLDFVPVEQTETAGA